MRVISSQEFNTNPEVYFDMAMDEELCIKRDNYMYRLMYSPLEMQSPKQAILEPDDDFRRAITMDEFIERAVVRLDKIDKVYAKK